jgi:hypothetical protein
MNDKIDLFTKTFIERCKFSLIAGSIIFVIFMTIMWFALQIQ